MSTAAKILGAFGLRLPVFGVGKAGAVPAASGDPSNAKYLNELGQWATAGGAGTPATSVTDETTYGITPAVGSSTNYARQDHTHGSPALPAHSALSSLAWNDSGHTGTANAIPVFGGGGAAAEVAIGAEGTVLQVVGGVIVWAALSVSLSVLQPDAQSFDLAPMDVISTVTQA